MKEIFTGTSGLNTGINEALSKQKKIEVASLLLFASLGVHGNDDLLDSLVLDMQDPDITKLHNDVGSGKKLQDILDLRDQDNWIYKVGREVEKVDNSKYTEIADSLKSRILSDIFLEGYLHAPDERTKQQLLTKQLQFITDGESKDDVYEPDPANPCPPTEFCLSFDGIGFMPIEDMTAIKAKAKSGKTHLCEILAAALASNSGECCGIKRTRIEPYKVLYVDTEQSHHSSYKLYIDILELAGLPTDKKNQNIVAINLRTTKKEERLNSIISKLESGVDVIIIDGIKDLSKDINDIKEADQLLESLTNILTIYKVNICSVLHENPSKDTDKMRGHLGTELCNKAFETLQVLKKDDIFNIVNSERREREIPTFAFRFNDSDSIEGCIPNCNDVKSNDSASYKIDGYQEWHELTGDTGWYLQDLGIAYANKYDLTINKKSKRCQTAEKRIKDAIQANYLRKEDGQKGLIYFNSQETPEYTNN